MSFKTVASYSSLTEAQVVRSKLEAYGISARIPDEHALSIGRGAYIGRDCTVVVQVDENQWDEARQLLEADEALESDLSLREQETKIASDDAFAGDPRPESRKGFWKKVAITAVGLTAVLGGIALFRRRNRRD